MRSATKRLSPRFRPFRIGPIAFSSCSLFFRVAQVQFGMIALRLENIGAFSELSRLAEVAGLTLTLTRRRLVLSIAT
jgi:hypothetical protein